jgi:hypothetical protein
MTERPTIKVVERREGAQVEPAPVVAIQSREQVPDARGIGPEGPPGPPGAEGPSGPVGPLGPSGAQGAQGIEGPVGPSGAEGQRGPRGPKGDLGPQGPEGSRGPVGLPGFSPALAVVPDGARRVLQLVDWIGEGPTKPRANWCYGRDWSDWRDGA